MEHIIYADILFLIDFTMDFFALYLTANIFHYKIKKIFIVFAAITGAFYSVTEVILRADSLIITAFFAFLMCIIAFGFDNIKKLISETFMFFAINLILGGGMTAIFSFFNSFEDPKHILIYGQITKLEEPVPLPLFVMGFLILTVITYLFGKLFTSNLSKKSVNAEIKDKNNIINCNLLCDSGNFLKEPISNDPIIFLSKGKFDKLIGEDNRKKLQQSNTEYLSENCKKIRFLIYETVNGQEMGICYKVDEIKINGKNVNARLMVGNKDNYGNFDGIVPIELIK